MVPLSEFYFLSKLASKIKQYVTHSPSIKLFWKPFNLSLFSCWKIITQTCAIILTTKWGICIDIESFQNRLLKVCYVLATSVCLSRLLFLFLRWPLTVLMNLTRQAVHTLSSLYYLDAYGYLPQFVVPSILFKFSGTKAKLTVKLNEMSVRFTLHSLWVRLADL
jgi:hypothetical protein